MNRLRTFLCTLGLHAWNPWTDPEPVILVYDYVFTASQDGIERKKVHGFTQHRRCKHCNLDQFRKYTAGEII